MDACFEYDEELQRSGHFIGGEALQPTSTHAAGVIESVSMSRCARGWWGDNPSHHVPVFVLTHHPRPLVEREGNTTFHFVTGGIHEALDLARKAAKGMDVRIGGGTNTVQQYLRAGLIAELHVAIAPVLLGRGERLFEGGDLRALGHECVQFAASEKATHVVLRRPRK
jgi:dihydrofolate reductase